MASVAAAVADGTWRPQSDGFKFHFRAANDRDSDLPTQSPNGEFAAVEYRVVWSILLAEQAFILLLAGLLLTVVVRRERRKRAAA